MEPLISVILPTYNRANLLANSIQSVLTQTFHQLELLIIDDNSSDCTKKIVQKFQKKDERVIYIKINNNIGAAAARNVGINNSKGKFIAFQDSDDIWKKDKLQKQFQVFQAYPQTGVVYSRYKIFKNNKVLIRPKDSNLIQGKIHIYLLQGNFIPIHSLIRREILIKFKGFDESLPRFQDWDLWLKISKDYNFSFTRQILVDVFQKKDGISKGSWSKFIQATSIILTNHYESFLQNQDAYSKRLWIVADAYVRNNQINQACDLFKKSLKIKFKFKTYLMFLFLKIFKRKLYLKMSNLFCSYC